MDSDRTKEMQAMLGQTGTAKNFEGSQSEKGLLTTSNLEDIFPAPLHKEDTQTSIAVSEMEPTNKTFVEGISKTL